MWVVTNLDQSRGWEFLFQAGEPSQRIHCNGLVNHVEPSQWTKLKEAVCELHVAPTIPLALTFHNQHPKRSLPTSTGSSPRADQEEDSDRDIAQRVYCTSQPPAANGCAAALGAWPPMPASTLLLPPP
jgi:hypothetical protein